MKAIQYIAFAATLLGASASKGADLNIYKAPPAPAVASWTGFYVDGDVGLRGALATASTKSIRSSGGG
jgi:hypothetical protein